MGISYRVIVKRETRTTDGLTPEPKSCVLQLDTTFQFRMLTLSVCLACYSLGLEGLGLL